MNDRILRVTAANGMIRGFFADTRETVNRAMDLHQTTAVVAAALGRLLTAGAMMGVMLKSEDDLLTITVKGSGEIGGVLVTADSEGHVKGYCDNPYADVPNKANGKLNVSGVIGLPGTLTVIKRMGFEDSKEPYVGTIELQTGEVAEDVAYYFVQSEQTPSVVSLGVLVDVDYTIRQAGGFILQLLPGADESLIPYLEEKMTGLDTITNLYEAGYTPESLAERLFGEVGYTVLDSIPVEYRCDCSRDRVERALISLGPEELGRMIAEDHQASVSCHFCNKAYEFTEAELQQLLERR